MTIHPPQNTISSLILSYKVIQRRPLRIIANELTLSCLKSHNKDLRVLNLWAISKTNMAVFNQQITLPNKWLSHLRDKEPLKSLTRKQDLGMKAKQKQWHL